MSFVYSLLFLLVLAGACFGSWKGALYWHNRTRDARNEDPRDQEIRELSAALSVARKNLEKMDNRSGSSAHELAVLQDQINKTSAALAESQGKIEAANAAVNREIETREALDARLAQMRRELDTAKSRVAELEVQVKIVAPSSGLVAGLDDVLEDDEKEVFTIRHEHKIFKQQVAELEQQMATEKAESARWKQHCTTLGTANKGLRQQIDKLTAQLACLDELKAKAAQLLVATADNEQLRTEIADLRMVAAQIPSLNARITELAGVQDENRSLQEQVATLSAVHAVNQQLAQQLADFEATKAQLLESRQNNLEMQKQLQELAGVREENRNLHTRIDALAAIETDNEALRSMLRNLQTTHAEALSKIQADNEQLTVRVAALDQIQAENTELLAQSRELRQLQGRHANLQSQLAAAHADHAQATAQRLQLEETLSELRSADAEAQRLRTAEAARSQANICQLQTELNALRDAATKAESERSAASAQLQAAYTLQTTAQAQTSELRIAHDILRDKVVQLEQAQRESDFRLQSVNDELLAANALTQQLREQLEVRADLPDIDPETASTPAESMTSSAHDVSGDARDDNSTTDSFPILTQATTPDDLKSIRGVGAKLEQKLNMIGVFNFRDLIQLEESSYARAADLIPDLALRMQRDRWKEQARKLHSNKYNESI